MVKKEMTYSAAIAEVEKILERFNSEQMEVDELGEQVKRATELIKFCREKLRKAESDVEAVLSQEE